jgi:hypothetical protein
MKQKMREYLDALEDEFRHRQANNFPDKLELCIGFDGRLVTQETYNVGAALNELTGQGTLVRSGSGKRAKKQRKSTEKGGNKC